jgi:hypothetical protein
VVADGLNLCPPPNNTPKPTPNKFYLEDVIYLDLADHKHFKQVTAASIEAIFIMLCQPSLTLYQDPISWDKLLELLVAPVYLILGLTLDLCRLTVSISLEFIAATVQLLGTTWGPQCCYFHAKEAKKFNGKLVLGNILTHISPATQQLTPNQDQQILPRSTAHHICHTKDSGG